jgi:hypothetical protein
MWEAAKVRGTEEQASLPGSPDQLGLTAQKLQQRGIFVPSDLPNGYSDTIPI